MARACRAAYSADIGIGITDTMGNVDPANAGVSIPGNVYYSFDIRGEICSFHKELPPMPTRLAYKLLVAEEVRRSLVKLV